MHEITLAILETKALKAFRNIFAHHKNTEAKVYDLVSCILFVASSIRKPTQVDNWQDMDVLTVLDVLIEQL